MSVSPLTEIEYRTWWLLENLGGHDLSPELLREELEGIRDSVERLKATEDESFDRLRQALDRANAWLEGQHLMPSPKARRHLTLVRSQDD